MYNNSFKSFLITYKNKLQKDSKFGLSFGRSIISSVNKRKFKELALLLNSFFNDRTEDFLYLQWCLALIDHVETRLYVNKQGTPKQYKTSNKLNVLFTKKGVEIINLSIILRTKNVLSKMLSKMSKDDIPMVTYNLQQTIKFKLFNHKTFVESFDINFCIQKKRF